MSNKRSVLSEGRLRQLKEEGAVYVIACGIPGCPCGLNNPQCERGFFSLFIQAIYGIDFAARHNVPYHVDFTTVKYCYTDITYGKGANFWNYYFKQPLVGLDNIPVNKVMNDFTELYPLRIWDRKHVEEIHESAVKHLEFQENVALLMADQREKFARKKILGVQIRCTDHAGEVAPVSFERYKKLIDKKVDTYDYLFVSTDDQRIIDKMKLHFGDKLLYNDVVRAADDKAVHTDMSFENRYQLGLDVLLDCYSLSLCDHALLIHSNISYAALLFNPFLSYTLLERKRVRWNKWKTLLVYYLNKWGVRKW